MMNAQSTIVKSCLVDYFKLEKSIFAENCAAHFTLKIQPIRDLEPTPLLTKYRPQEVAF